ncbi:MAG TPA: ankyrin repeat domain-containing protein [Archangium sp.]|nr:ankyrin repeat domain-containing protein [Archangium sp.]
MASEAPKKKKPRPFSITGDRYDLMHRGLSYNGDFIGACEWEHLEVVEEFIRRGVDINRLYGWKTPLMGAALSGVLGSVELLLRAGADVNAVNSDGRGALHLVLTLCDNNKKKSLQKLDVMRALLAAGADVNRADAQGGTPLMGAARWGNADAVKLLLEAGANVNAVNAKGETAMDLLHSKAREGEVGRLLAAAGGAEIGASERKLREAAERDDVAELDALLASGAAVEGADKQGRTALMLAAEAGALNAVERLLVAGADPALPQRWYLSAGLNNSDGYTALHFAVKKGHVAVVERLARTHARDVPAEGRGQLTPLMLAASGKKTAVVRTLIQAGADVNHANSGGQTALHLAANLGTVEVVRLLLKHGAELDARDKDGATPLIRAVQGGCSDIVEVLLEAGADRTAEDKYQRTALRTAQESEAGAGERLRQLLEQKKS